MKKQYRGKYKSQYRKSVLNTVYSQVSADDEMSRMGQSKFAS